MTERNAPETTKSAAPPNRLLDFVMAWTVFTTVFAWLPIVRSIARPEAYSWRIFGLNGEGTGGHFWVFPILALYSVILFTHPWWKQRGLFRILLLAWHFSWVLLLVRGVLSEGSAATWQGQGLGVNIKLWVVVIVYAGLALLVTRWTVLDWRSKFPVPRPIWTVRNSRRAATAACLLPVALLLFRWGSNYDWVTAAAILITIVQWVTFSSAFEVLDSQGPSPRMKAPT